MSNQVSEGLAEIASIYLAQYSGIPPEHIGWMSAERGQGKTARAYLANPQLKVMILAETSMRVEPQSLEHFQAAKKERPDVPFLVLVASEEEADCQRFRDAGAEYVVWAWLNPDGTMAQLAQIGAELASKTS